MEIQIYNPTQTQPLPPIQWNYEDVKKWVADGLEDYKGRVYTESNIALAKKDRAALNKLAEAIDAKRKEMKALYLSPYEEFEAQAKELTAMVKAQAAEIDIQVKAYDENRKREKEAKCRDLYTTMIGSLAELVPYERLHNPKWLNVTTSVNAIYDEMESSIGKIRAGLSSIDKLNLAPDIAEQVKGVFLRDFDLAVALAEKERIEKRREELARYKASQEAAQATHAQDDVQAKEIHADRDMAAREAAGASVKEKLYTVDFRVFDVTAGQLADLKDFLNTHGIRYGRP